MNLLSNIPYTLIEKGYYNEADAEIKKLSDNHPIKSFLNVKLCRERGMLQQGLHFASIALNFYKNVDIKSMNDETIVSLYFRVIGEKAYLEFLSGLYDLSLNTISQGKEKIKEHSLEEILLEEILFLEFTEGNVEANKGNPKVGLELLRKVQQEYKKINNIRGLGFVLNDIGYIYYLKGELTQAIEYYSKSLEIKEEYGNPNDTAFTLNNIGIIYYDKGELKKAQSVFERSLQVYEKSRNLIDEGNVINLLGLIQFSLNNTGMAIEYLEKGLKLRKASGNEVLLSSSLLNLIVVLIASEKHDLLNKYLNELKLLTISTDSALPTLYYKYTQALIKKNTPLMKAKVEGTEIFLKIIEEKTRDFEIVFNSMFHLCELYLEEFTIFQNDQIFIKAKNLVEKIVEHARLSNSYIKIIDSLILESKFEVIEGNYETSINILDHARLIADEKNLTMLKEKVEDEMENIETKLEEWRMLLDRNSSLIERIMNSGLRDYLNSASSLYYQGINQQGKSN